MDNSNLEHPLRPLVSLWLQKIKLASERKAVEWEKDALDALAFFRGPYDFMYGGQYMSESRGFRQDPDSEDIPAPSFQVTCNKTAEAVQIFGPMLYHRNPYRQVNPRRVPIPPPAMFGDMNDPAVQLFAQQAMASVQGERSRDQAVAQMLEFYLNFTPSKLNLEKHARLMVDECLITGLGLLWPEVYQAPGSSFRYVGSFWRSAFDLQMDPDMNDMDLAQWAACRRVQPTWLVERKFNLPEGSVRANYESCHAQADVASDLWGQGRRARGETADLVVYWEVYSKMGLGGRLKGCLPALKAGLEQFGDYCYLALAEGMPYPLNLPSEALSLPAQELSGKLAWPTPHWRMGNWPFAAMILHPVPGKLWPMGHFTPAMGELKALNWIFSFIVSKMRTTCRDFIAIAKSAGEEFKQKVLHGRDLTLLDIERVHGTISEVVQILQFPQMNADIFKVIDILMDLFERRTGLSELLYGSSPNQLRSATEANVKNSHLQIRPDDMAKQLEAAMTVAAQGEAMTARFHLQPQDLAPILGQVGAQFWQMVVGATDLDTISHGLEYRIESGSTRKPNRERDENNYKTALQTLLAPLFQLFMATGQATPINTLLTGWAKSIDLNPEGLLIQPPPPPPMPGAGPGAPPGPGGPPQPAPPAQAA